MLEQPFTNILIVECVCVSLWMLIKSRYQIDILEGTPSKIQDSEFLHKMHKLCFYSVYK